MAEIGKRLRESKNEARTEILNRMGAMSALEREEAQIRFYGHLNLFLKDRQGLWGAYRAKQGEISPCQSIQTNTHLRWVYPRVNLNTLEFYLDPKVWRTGAYGIEEPDPDSSQLKSIHELEGYLVPGLAFDQKGTRIGRGRGFFDRALIDFKGLKVGLAFECQRVTESLPQESFDIGMDFVITDRGIYKINSEGDRRND